MKISANMVVKNEEEYIGQVLTQVLKLADEVFIIDNGSTDKTRDIIQTFPVNFSISTLPVKEIRNDLLKKSTGDWIWIVDGDEVWPDEELIKLKQLPEKYPDIIAFAFSFTQFMPYGIANHKARSIRFVKKTLNLKWINNFPNEIFADERGPIISQAGAKISRQDNGDIMFVPDIKFLHYSGIKGGQWRKEQPRKFQQQNGKT